MRNCLSRVEAARVDLPLGKLTEMACFALRLCAIAFAALAFAAFAAHPAETCESCKRDVTDRLLFAEADAHEICNVMASIAMEYIASRSDGAGILKAVRQVLDDDSIKGHESGWTASRISVIAFLARIERSGAVQSYIDMKIEDPGIVHGLYYLECMDERSAA